MIQPAYRFYLNGTQYERTFLRAVSFLSASLLLAIVALSLGVWLWSGYPHTLTPYLKWRDALVALLWSLAFVCLGGGVIVFRFLFALRSGYKEGMVTLTGDNALLVRDLSHENLASVFWMMNSAFWCFVAMLVGLTPEILFQWTLHLPNVVLAVITTGLAAILGLAGLVVSIVAAVFVFIGCVGAVTFCRKLGSSHVYQLNAELNIRVDNFALTIMQPGAQESTIELSLLANEDQRSLLSLLHSRWQEAQAPWNPELGTEIVRALQQTGETAASL